MPSQRLGQAKKNCAALSQEKRTSWNCDVWCLTARNYYSWTGWTGFLVQNVHMFPHCGNPGKKKHGAHLGLSLVTVPEQGKTSNSNPDRIPVILGLARIILEKTLCFMPVFLKLQTQAVKSLWNPHFPSSNVWHSYWKWPSQNSEFSHSKWWFSIAM